MQHCVKKLVEHLCGKASKCQYEVDHFLQFNTFAANVQVYHS